MLQKTFLAAVGILAGALPAAWGADSIFPDKNLEAAVRQYVFAKRDNKEPLTAEDVKSISTIHARGKGIKDLKGLESCQSLAECILSQNEVSDLGPLKDLKGLQLLDLSRNKVSDLKPLEGLKGLQYLQLEENQVKDLGPLAGLTSLRSLYLSKNRVSDLEPLRNLKSLWSLYLGQNQITGIEALEKLSGLGTLELRDNRISDLKPLGGLKALHLLFLENNKVEDLAPLVEAAQADAKGEQRYAPFLRLFVTGNPLSDGSRQGLEALKKIGVRLNEDQGRAGRETPAAAEKKKVKREL